MFLPSTCHINRPLLLIIDGHAAHVNLNVIKLLQENQIVCLLLPPHSTHCLQPIDVVLFNNIKADWLSIVKNHMRAGNKSITNGHIPKLMKQLFITKQAFTTTRIVSSFARSGEIFSQNFSNETTTI
jgi:LEA14-like dessication related protein